MQYDNNWNNNWGTQPLFNNYMRQLPHYEIIKVNGEAGARSFQMAPNSNVFLADATDSSLIWLAQTDGAGYLTTTPLNVSIRQAQTQTNLEERIKQLEDKYEQLYIGLGKQSKKQRQQHAADSDQSADTAS